MSAITNKPPSAMNTYQITKALNSCKGFRGVFAKDRLSSLILNTFPAALVINTDKSSGPGEHWVAVYIDENGYGSYFDSYGRQPLVEIGQFLRKTCRNGFQLVTSMPLQALASIVCGQYCIFYLLMRMVGWSDSKIVATLTKNTAFVTDNFVNQFITKRCNISTKVYSLGVLNQICQAFRT